MVRDTPKDNDKAPATLRAGKIIEWMMEEGVDGGVMVIANIKAFIYGREVGFDVRQLFLDSKTHQISGTELRERNTLEELYGEKNE